jgi:signal peptidase I
MSIRRLGSAGCAIAFLGALAFVLWPTSLGGSSLFVVVRGKSMEPTYHQGDLLYARTARDYEPGDIAVYRIPEGQPGAGALVVHRIKRVLANATYVFEGDNKTSPDDVTLRRRDLIAKPIADLGNLPTRALILLPIALTIVAATSVTIALWPDRPRPSWTARQRA